MLNEKVDYCSECSMWSDLTIFKSMGDIKAGIAPDDVAQAFLDISKRCSHHNYKRIGMAEVNECVIHNSARF